jgi:hypothetical protein
VYTTLTSTPSPGNVALPGDAVKGEEIREVIIAARFEKGRRTMSVQTIGVSLTGSFPQGVPAIRDMRTNVRRAEQLGFDSIWL